MLEMAVPSAQEFCWQGLARLSSGRVYHSLAEVGGQLYVLGGCDAAGRPFSALELYSPEGDQWVSLPPMPLARAGAAVVTLGKQLLVVGGVGKDQRPLKAVEVYNTDDGKWMKRSSLKEAIMGVAVTVKDGRAFAVGGMGPDLLPRSTLQQYDPRKDMWALLPPMPTPRYDVNVNLHASKLYVAGGRQCKRSLKAFEVFDMESRLWSVLPALPCKRSYSGVLWDTCGRLCWLGGLRQGGVHQRSKFTNNVNIYSPSEDENLSQEEEHDRKDPLPLALAQLLKLQRISTALSAGKQTEQEMVLAKARGDCSLEDQTCRFRRCNLGRQNDCGRWSRPPALSVGLGRSLPSAEKEMGAHRSNGFPRCSATTIVIHDRLFVVGGVNQIPSSAHEVLFIKEKECL